MLSLDTDLLASNKQTEICSVYVAADDVEKSLRANAEHIRELAQIIHSADPGEILLVGSGASYCALYAGYYFLKTSSRLRATLSFGPELVGDNPPGLTTSRPSAILASYSGKTADTVEASRYLQQLGIPRLAISRDEAGPLAQGTESVLTYHSNCLFTSAMANLLQLLAEVLALRGETAPAKAMKEALASLPDQMHRALARSDQEAQSALAQLKDADLIHVLGDGALWGLTYQYGYTNLMEYARIYSACLRSSEWRHGPLEVLFRRPSVLCLLGNDGMRHYGEAARDYCARRGANVVTFDVADYFDAMPVLAPFVLHGVTQLFLLYLCTHAGIDMDEYLEMHAHPYLPSETYF